MSKKAWVWGIIALIIVAGGCFWGGMTYAQSKAASARSSLAAGFAGRGGAGGLAGGTFATSGGGTVGTVIQVGDSSFTVQLPSSTSTTASTGTKLVLVNNSTEVDELESVPLSNLQVGQTVTVAGTANSDGSVTATSVMIRPATTRTDGTSSDGGTTQTSSGQ